MHKAGIRVVEKNARKTDRFFDNRYKRKNRKMGRRIRYVISFLAVIVPLIIASGCSIPLLMSGMSAAPGGASYVSSIDGKIATYQIASYKDVLTATRRAAESLSLEVEKEEIAAEQALFQFADLKGHKVDLVIEQRTATMTYLEVDTGWFGHHGMGHLLLSQILNEISEAGESRQDCGDKPGQ
jgi:Protein of unknown function (DUF3568)